MISTDQEGWFMAVLEELQQAIISGNRDKAKELTQKALDEGLEARTIVVEGIAAAMEVVGEKFRANEFFVPELLIAQRAMKESLSMMSGEAVDYIGTVVIGTVKGDLHDIGKNLVAAMLEGAGFKVVDLKVDVSPEQFVAAANENSANLIAMSALLTTTMGSMRDTVAALGDAGLRDKVKVIVGGAPLTQSYADEIKADGYAPDAASAVEKAKQLLPA
jgi:5-methyltetrahydrofolate--homocysteine methyltransferase